MADQSLISPIELSLEVGMEGGFYCTSITGRNFWSFNDRQLPANVHIQDELASLITLTAITPDNEGWYECQGRREGGRPFRARGKLEVMNRELYTSREN